MNKKYCTAVVLAAGRGVKMGTQATKQYLEIGGKPVVIHALEAFQAFPLIDEVILMTNAQHVGYYSREMIPAYELSKVSTVEVGESERYESVWKALCTMTGRDEKEDEGLWTDRKNSYVFIHDGARPFVTTDIIARAYEDARHWDACVMGVPVKDAIKRMDGRGFVVGSPNRNLIWQTQTPQIFSIPPITKAFERQLREDCTHAADDAMVVETQVGVRVHVTNGSYENIKVITPEDLLIAEAVLKKRR